MLNSRIVFAKIGVVLLTLLACYWLQTTSLIALGIFVALHFVYAIVTLALRTRMQTAAIMRASSVAGAVAATNGHSMVQRNATLQAPKIPESNGQGRYV